MLPAAAREGDERALVQLVEYPDACLGLDGYEQVRQWLVEQTLIGRTATPADVGNVAAVAASELAGTLTGTMNMTAGAMLD